MELKQIEINKFRSIDSISINIDDLAILIGENNAGKTNILKALELFYQDSVRGINEECFYFKNQNQPISISITYDKLNENERKQKYLKHLIYNDSIKVKKVIEWDNHSQKYKMTLFGWQAKPKEVHFDLSKFDEYKSQLDNIIESHSLPDYFKTDKGTVTHASYKQGILKHITEGKVEFGDPGWEMNPGGYKEVFSDLLPMFYLVPAVKDAQDESKTTQQTMLGKLLNDLTNRIISKNPKFEEVKKQIEGLKKYLNKSEEGDDSERLQEIKDFEEILSSMISENMPGTKVGIEIVTPELIDLFKDTKITLDDALSTSIDSKGHGLQRALIFAYIRAYAKTISTIETEEGSFSRNFILAIEEPELYLHPNGQRKMMNVLRNISKNDQVLICTHSNFFVDMFDYQNIIVVNRDNSGTTNVFQVTEEIFKTEDEESRKRLKKTFRYLSLFDLSRSEMFFSKKVVLVEGDTENFIVPFWASRLAQKDKRYDFSSNNICVIECGGKTNIHIFMRVLNKFKIPYVVIHDIDPIDFPEDKEGKTDQEKAKLRMFKENEFIEKTLDPDYGHIIKIKPELERVIGISKSQAEKHSKIGAAFFKYDEMDIDNYPSEVIKILDLIINWQEKINIIEINKE